MSENVTGADDQQGSPLLVYTRDDPSETTRRTPPRSNQEIVAYLQGALHDASLNKRKRYRFTQKGDAWLLVLKDLFRTIGHKAWLYKEGKDREVYALETTATFLDFTCDTDDFLTEDEKIGYIRGFFDAEGGIPKKLGDRFYIQLVQKDRTKIEKLKLVLLQLGIDTGVVHNPSHRVDPNYWRVFVSTRSHRKFAETIGSWHPRKAVTFNERMKI